MLVAAPQARQPMTVDLSVMYHQDRRVTRPIARYYWQLAQSQDHRDWRGLRYTSRVHDAWECWALWEPSPVREGVRGRTAVTRTSPDLLAAAELLGVAV